MKCLSIYTYVLLFFTAALMNGCSGVKTMGLNSIELTNQLKPGMSYDEVEAILGKPKSSKSTNDLWIARWNLQEKWKGYVPYDLVFDSANKSLISWSENSADFEQKQQQMKIIADEVEKQANSMQTGGDNAPYFENDAELMRSFAGSYYSFSAVGGGQTGGTETKVMLCENGTYRNQSESGYSGSDWGTSSQGGGNGTWRITGNMNSGTLVTTDNNGKSTTYKFERCGNDCVYFGNTKFAYAGRPDC